MYIHFCISMVDTEGLEEGLHVPDTLSLALLQAGICSFKILKSEDDTAF